MRYFQFLSTMSTQIEVISTDFWIEVVFYLKNVEIFLIFKICSIFACFFFQIMSEFTQVFLEKSNQKCRKILIFPEKAVVSLTLNDFFTF